MGLIRTTRSLRITWSLNGSLLLCGCGPTASPDHATEAAKFVGLTEAQLLVKFGAPVQRWDGPYGLPRKNDLDHLHPLQTWVYERFGGTVDVELSGAHGTPISIDACWVPAGTQF